ncbi:hydrolase [Peribacillus sp. SCS-155]|uniref:hydrolase n=1 Tax=Peribacillus sedimenti TaxID=3115297 RepID=UPI0039059CD0
MEQRTFQIDSEWCIVYYPWRPSGFAVLVIGDRNQFVDQEGSYWLQHPGRLQILDYLKSAGYMMFSSNFYGSSWGCPKSVELARELYLFVMKNEILNSRIHILAEGSGALTAMKLMHEMKDAIRSAVFINPVLSLKKNMAKEKESKFFYKKWIKEVAQAYEMETKECEKQIESLAEYGPPIDIPLKIIHVIGTNDKEQYEYYRLLEENPGRETMEIQYLLPEKRYKIPHQIEHFCKKYEEIL